MAADEPVRAALPDADALDEIRREVAALRPYRVRIPIYEGPIDLLLFLVERHEVAIYDIPIAKLIEEYFEYIVLMEVLNIEIASEFLVMAATLMVIKAKTLLPAEADSALDELSEEPAGEAELRAELERRLAEYQRFRDSAEYLRTRIERQALVHGRVSAGEVEEFAPGSIPIESVSVFDLVSVFKQMLLRAVPDEPPIMERRKFTVGEKMEEVIRAVALCPGGLSFFQTVSERPTRLEVIVTFLAILELIRRRRIVVQQQAALGEIRIYAGPEWVTYGSG
jgi:segregation and condensation protein A